MKDRGEGVGIKNEKEKRKKQPKGPWAHRSPEKPAQINKYI